jgi:hypothetical protein
MAKGNHTSERRFLRDEETGARIVRLSGFPTLNYHVYMHSRCFTPDSKDAVFYSLRQLVRGSPRDIFAVAVDGLLLRQLTDCDGVGWMTCSSVDRSVFFTHGKSIRCVDVDSLEEKLIADLPLGPGIISVSHDSKRILSQSGERIMVTDVPRGSTEVVYEHPTNIGHLQLEPIQSRFVLFHDRNPDRGRPRLWTIGADGSDPNMVYDGSIGDPSHFVWLPGKNAIISTLQNPPRGIIRISLGGEAEVISDKHHYWHPGARLDGGMICSETLSPDLGLFKIDPADGTDEKICLTKSSNSHPQWTHPHPTWSPDGSKVMFTSTREGSSHVYLVEVV